MLGLNLYRRAAGLHRLQKLVDQIDLSSWPGSRNATLRAQELSIPLGKPSQDGARR